MSISDQSRDLIDKYRDKIQSMIYDGSFFLEETWLNMSEEERQDIMRVVQLTEMIGRAYQTSPYNEENAILENTYSLDYKYIDGSIKWSI